MAILNQNFKTLIIQLLNVLPCNLKCCSPEVGMLPDASAEGNIHTKGEKHICYMAEHLTIDLLCHYHMNNMHACNIYCPFIMQIMGVLS